MLLTPILIVGEMTLFMFVILYFALLRMLNTQGNVKISFLNLFQLPKEI